MAPFKINCPKHDQGGPKHVQGWIKKCWVLWTFLAQEFKYINWRNAVKFNFSKSNVRAPFYRMSRNKPLAWSWTKTVQMHLILDRNMFRMCQNMSRLDRNKSKLISLFWKSHFKIFSLATIFFLCIFLFSLA